MVVQEAIDRARRSHSSRIIGASPTPPSPPPPNRIDEKFVQVPSRLIKRREIGVRRTRQPESAIDPSCSSRKLLSRDCTIKKISGKEWFYPVGAIGGIYQSNGPDQLAMVPSSGILTDRKCLIFGKFSDVRRRLTLWRLRE